MDWKEILIQAIGILGILASILAFQCNKHKPIILLRATNELVFGVQYLLLGAYTGMMMNFIGVIRNLVFTKLVEKEKSTRFAASIFSLIFVLFIGCTWAGSKSLLSGIAKIISTFAYGCKNVTLVRLGILVTSSSWLFYNFFIGSWAGCLCELFTIVSIIIGIFKFDLRKQGRNSNENEVKA